MRIVGVGIAVLVVSGCTGMGEPQPVAGVQTTATLDCDAAVKPQGTVGVSIGKGGIKPRAGVGLSIDLLKLGKGTDSAEDCAKAGVKTGANATVGIAVGG